MKPEAFYRTVMDTIGDEDRAGAVRATAAVLAALRDHEPEFCRRVALDAKLPVREGRRATLAVFGALKMQLSAGEADDVLAQLPRDLKLMWSVALATSEKRVGNATPD